MTTEIAEAADVHEINIHCRKNAKEIYSKYMISDRERRTIINSEGDAACMLYEYYLRMASKGNTPLTDQHAADYFGWTPSKVQRNRLALTRAGWFRQVRGTYSDGRKTISYYIGESAVSDSLKGVKPTQ